jgi:hypothetical protein
VERRTDWARIVCSNGWTAWVDARRLVPNGSVGEAPLQIDEDLSRVFGEALARYATLVGELQAGRIDLEAFRRDAFRAGLVVRDSEAWVLDLASERWWRYDGLGLTTIDVGTSADEGG